MAKARRRPGDRSLLPVLQGRAEALADTFNAQRVANTLWAYATLGRMPGEGLMRGREAVGEVVADTFKAHDVATTLWACATLGRAPGEGVMKGLEGRAEAWSWGLTFKAQNVANMLRAYATLGCVSGEGLMEGLLERRTEVVADLFECPERGQHAVCDAGVPAPSVLYVVPGAREAGCGMVQASAQQRASFGVCASGDIAEFVAAARERVRIFLYKR